LEREFVVPHIFKFRLPSSDTADDAGFDADFDADFD